MRLSTGTYTIQYNKQPLALISKGNIKCENMMRQVNILWDTGCNCSCITKSLAEELQLPIIRTAEHKLMDNILIANVYMVDVWLNKDMFIQNLHVMASGISDTRVDILLGMDVIK